MLKRLAHRLGRSYVTAVLESDFRSQQFKAVNEKPIQYAFLFRFLTGHNPKSILDVGCGLAALPALLRDCGFLVTATDRIKGYWTESYFNRHYHVLEDDIQATTVAGRFDLVTSLDMLHAVEDPDAAMRSMFRVLPPGGSLILSVIYNEHESVPDIYRHPGAGYGKELPYKATIYSRADIDRWARDNGATVVEQEHWQYFTGKYWTMGERMWPPRRAGRDELHQFTCVLFRKEASAR